MGRILEKGSKRSTISIFTALEGLTQEQHKPFERTHMELLLGISKLQTRWNTSRSSKTFLVYSPKFWLSITLELQESWGKKGSGKKGWGMSEQFFLCFCVVGIEAKTESKKVDNCPNGVVGSKSIAAVKAALHPMVDPLDSKNADVRS